MARSTQWARLSSDGSQLAYVMFDPKSFTTSLYVSTAAGTRPRLVMPSDTFYAVDAPLFSPDGGSVLFSAVGESYSPALSLLDMLLGVQIASAHNVPSDWWRIPTAGGKPERLTQLFGTGLYSDFSLDGQHIAFASSAELYVMNPDGSDLIDLGVHGATGTVQWIR